MMKTDQRVVLANFTHRQDEQWYSRCVSITKSIDVRLIPGDSLPCLTSFGLPTGCHVI